jgi:intein/homing endonuclease
MCTYLRCVPYDIVKLKTESGYFIRIPNVKHILMGWGLHMKKSEDKFIPNEYKYNSREVRLNILKGLMDSDGFVDSNGVPIIGVSSKQLADDIAFISRSLGYNCL